MTASDSATFVVPGLEEVTDDQVRDEYEKHVLAYAKTLLADASLLERGDRNNTTATLPQYRSEHFLTASQSLPGRLARRRTRPSVGWILAFVGQGLFVAATTFGAMWQDPSNNFDQLTAAGGVGVFITYIALGLRGFKS
ncbi:hypothetical protein C5C56_06100 [Rathayibacter sp. AY1D1]|uniref:hypothetical protein n=1 Tax=Rathayibacter sp. AY1D1 TaxID=2080542 RepID=UPI000CE81668|nr:hypothetical protein [Rathayibacter sp. AY1D1]PPI00609.1 hypothetical protein C5C56_06100 [Rathayibacter sp. AY1D1]